MRLDRFLTNQIKDKSRSRIQNWIRLKLVLVNGRGHYHTNCIDTYKKNFTEDVFKKRLLTILDLNH